MKGRSPDEWVEFARKVLDIEVEGILEVKKNLDREFYSVLKLLASCKGRIVVTGIGKSGLVGRKIAATLSSTGTPAFFLHPVEGAHGDLGMIQKEDVVLAISNSGETDELNAIIPVLKSLGLKIVALTAKRDSTLAKMSDFVLSIFVPREACTLNLAPTASTTATLALGDAIAVSLTRWKEFKKEDFKRFHPGGDLGRRLSMDINEIMQRDNLPIAYLNTKLKDAIELIDKGGLGCVIVVDEKNRLKGIITDGDIRRMVVKNTLDLDGIVKDFMTKNPRFGREGETGARMLDIMEQAEITVLPVVDNNMVVKGIVHLHDLLGKGRLTFNGL
ncbi:KpsF/GutQ family sugar-phosphate isomerase [Desulfothermus sp.]